MEPIRRRPRRGAGTVVPQSVEAALTFPADLVHPPTTQLSQYADAINDRVRQLDAAARSLAEGFGIPMSSFVLNPVTPVGSGDSLSVVTAMLQGLVQKEERVSLERRGSRWGLYFTRGAAIVAPDKAIETVPLVDAPLDVRERFLAKSEEFFRAYLKLCEDRLGTMKSSVGAANRTLALLASLRLE